MKKIFFSDFNTKKNFTSCLKIKIIKVKTYMFNCKLQVFIIYFLIIFYQEKKDELRVTLKEYSIVKKALAKFEKQQQ